MAQSLDKDNLVQVEARPLEDDRWQVTIVAYDYLGELSLICGLFFVYGLDIQAGEIFTYEVSEQSTRDSSRRLTRQTPPEAARLARPVKLWMFSSSSRLARNPPLKPGSVTPKTWPPCCA
jgi:hypothetical protein